MSSNEPVHLRFLTPRERLESIDPDAMYSMPGRAEDCTAWECLSTNTHGEGQLYRDRDPS